ncbi:MAG: deoxyguanosinetriphosphate triphosphohydrolase [Pseudomonadota bacterium]
MNVLPINHSRAGPSGDLSKLACVIEISHGRRHQEAPPSYRSEYQRDRDRIIHSSAFRRLEYKTQVFANHEGDMFRTRLTHSLEVAQVARTIARALSVNEDLTEAIALAHDLGHAPFGHAGQEALNKCMRTHGGFEHNYQSLRVVDELENRYPQFKGLNLLFETREGILKHCSRTRAASLGPVGKRILEGRAPSLEAQIVNLADEIAYNHHDIDDGLRAGLLTSEILMENRIYQNAYSSVLKSHPDSNEQVLKHATLREMLSCFVNDLIESSISRYQAHQTPGGVLDPKLNIVTFSDSLNTEHTALKKLLFDNLYRHPKVAQNNTLAQEVIQQLFNHYIEHPENISDPDLPSTFESDLELSTYIADYIAGMTDRFAVSKFNQLFSPRRMV